MTTTTHPSGLPEQEPTSPTAVVLCTGEAWVRTDIGLWESLSDADSWDSLRVNAAEKGGATLFDIAEAFAGDLVSAEWRSGDPDEKLTELLRVAEMEGAHVTATRHGATRSGNVHHVERSVRIHLGIFSGEVVIDLRLGGWTLTVTAPAPKSKPGADIPDEVVGAAMGVLYDAGDGELPTNEAMRAALAAADAKRAELEGQA